MPWKVRKEMTKYFDDVVRSAFMAGINAGEDGLPPGKRLDAFSRQENYLIWRTTLAEPAVLWESERSKKTGLGSIYSACTCKPPAFRVKRECPLHGYMLNI
jgi:hypothetical protein